MAQRQPLSARSRASPPVAGHVEEAGRHRRTSGLGRIPRSVSPSALRDARPDGLVVGIHRAPDLVEPVRRRRASRRARGRLASHTRARRHRGGGASRPRIDLSGSSGSGVMPHPARQDAGVARLDGQVHGVLTLGIALTPLVDPRERLVEGRHRHERRIAEPADDLEATVDVEHPFGVTVGVRAEDQAEPSRSLRPRLGCIRRRRRAVGATPTAMPGSCHGSELPSVS